MHIIESMTIYKVHIKTEGDKTTYKTNDTTLATIECRGNDKYIIFSNSGKELAATSSAAEADETAREKITAFFARLGIVPNFISE